MTLRMVRDEKQYWVPQLICDYCRQPITNLELALVVWTDPRGYHNVRTAGDQATADVYHKGRCDQLSSIDRDGEYRPWSQLTEILLQIAELKVPVPSSLPVLPRQIGPSR